MLAALPRRAKSLGCASDKCEDHGDVRPWHTGALRERRPRDSVVPELKARDACISRDLSNGVRVLLRLAEREATSLESTDALRLRPGAITRVRRRPATLG